MDGWGDEELVRIFIRFFKKIYTVYTKQGVYAFWTILDVGRQILVTHNILKLYVQRVVGWFLKQKEKIATKKKDKY